MTRPSEVQDLVDAMTSHAVDYVDRIFGSNHDKFCNYRPSITEHGYVYCDTCGCQINSIFPVSESFMEFRRGVDLLGPGIPSGSMDEVRLYR